MSLNVKSNTRFDRTETWLIAKLSNLPHPQFNFKETCDAVINVCNHELLEVVSTELWASVHTALASIKLYCYLKVREYEKKD